MLGLLLALGGLLGCPRELGPVTPLREWTVLVHFATDTDPDSPDHLEPYADADLDELREGLVGVSDARVVVVTQVDRPGPGGYERSVVGGASYGVVDEDVPPAEALRTFLAWGVDSFPAQHYAVVVWGHGKGWRNAGKPPAEGFSLGLCGGGIGWDEHPVGVIDIPALAAALDEARLHAGSPVDVYVADACLMQTVEVATALADTSRYIVGSEQVGSYLGLPYRELVRELAGPPTRRPPPGICSSSDEGCRVAWSIPELVAEAFGPGGRQAAERPDDAETFTSAAVDTAGLAALRAAMIELGSSLGAWIEAKPLRSVGLRQLLEDCNTPDFLCGSRDLGVFLHHLRFVVSSDGGADETTASLLVSIDAAAAALEGAIVHARFGSRYEEDCEFDNRCRDECYRGRQGLGVWLPRDRKEWDDREGELAGSPLAQWDDWLDVLR